MSFHVRVRAQVGALALDVEIEGGCDPVALVGPNGGGKTTLLHLITGALRPDSGSVKVLGRQLFDEKERIDVPIEQRRISYLPQGYGLFPHMTVLANVAFGLRHMERSLRHDAARRTLAELQCESLVARYPDGLSGGERQRVALARALAVEPDMLLLDEPLAAMDATGRRSVRALLAARLGALGRPAIVVTHDVRDVAAVAPLLVYVMEAGRIVQAGSLKDLRAAPLSDFVAEFVGV